MEQLKINPVQQGRLRVFLGLKTIDKVLLIGAEGVKKYLSLLSPCGQYADTLSAWKGDTKYRCLLFDAQRYSSKLKMKKELEYAYGLLADDGIILILASDFFTLKYLKADTRKDYFTTAFLPFPRKTTKTDEFPRNNCVMFANHYEYGRVTYWLQMFGLYQAFHNCYFVIKSKIPVEENSLFGKVSTLLTNYLGESYSIKIERFDARLRGALIVFISMKGINQHFIARIVTEDTTNIIVGKNQQFLNKLHANSKISKNIKIIIPKTVAEITWQGSTIYLEDWMQGVLAWKLINKRNANMFFEKSVRFLQEFNSATGTKKLLDEAMWEQLFREDERRFQNIHFIEKLQKKIIGLLAVIKKNFFGEEYTFVASHGDFGYGNIILNPHSYEITGVIDWDTGRTEEFPGVDFFNLLIQQGRSLKLSLFDSAIAVMKNLKDNTLPDVWRDYLKTYSATKTAPIFFLGVAMFRYMSRAAQYEKIFYKEQDGYLKMLHHYEELILK